MLKSKKCLDKRCVLSRFKRIILTLILIVSFINNTYAQCTPPIDIPFSLVELDSTINYTFTSSITGTEFTQPLYLNLPLCPEYAEEGAGCTQVAISPLNYSELGLGYSGGTLQVFWRDIWENQFNTIGY